MFFPLPRPRSVPRDSDERWRLQHMQRQSSIDSSRRAAAEGKKKTGGGIFTPSPSQVYYREGRSSFGKAVRGRGEGGSFASSDCSACLLRTLSLLSALVQVKGQCRRRQEEQQGKEGKALLTSRVSQTRGAVRFEWQQTHTRQEGEAVNSRTEKRTGGGKRRGGGEKICLHLVGPAAKGGQNFEASSFFFLDPLPPNGSASAPRYRLFRSAKKCLLQSLWSVSRFLRPR